MEEEEVRKRGRKRRVEESGGEEFRGVVRIGMERDYASSKT